jgi:RNA polymerase sigma-70 factor (ECF subfamily)
LPETIHTDASIDIDNLVEKAGHGDGEAFGKLYDMHVDRVYRHIYYRTSNTVVAEDLTQQTFIKAWQAIGRYKKKGSPFLGWLIKIGHNLVIDYYRSRKTGEDIDFDTVVSAAENNPEYIAESHYDRVRIQRAIGKLKGDQQQVVLMRFIEDFSFAEIAAVLGKREGAVRVILHRGLAKLREILEKE